MRTSLPMALVMLVVAAVPAMASVECHGIFEFEDGELHARFRCRYRDDLLRRVRAVCRDGEPGCDADGACDGVCRFALCSDAACTDTVDVAVPLRRHGKAKGRTVFRSGNARVVLRCLPSRGACGPGTTIPPGTSTTSTTLPARPCTGTLAGAAQGAFDCSVSLSRSILGLPVLTLRMSGPEIEGGALILLLGRSAGEHRLGTDVVLAAVDLSRPVLSPFQAVPGRAGAGVELILEEAVFGEAHGVLDATLPSVWVVEPLRLHAEF